MVILSLCLICQIISFILPSNEYGCTLEQRWEVGLRLTYRRCRFWKKKNLFRWSSFWSWRLCKQAKLSHLGHRKPVRIHKTHDALKTSHCLVRILVQRLGPFFFKNEQRQAVTVNGDRYRAMLNEFLFIKIKEEDIGNIWFQHSMFSAHCFWRLHYQPQS